MSVGQADREIAEVLPLIPEVKQAAQVGRRPRGGVSPQPNRPLTDQAWTTEAACVGQWDLFSDPHADSIEAARRICYYKCPVREQCFEWAVDNGETEGVWGGEDFAALTQHRKNVVRLAKKGQAR